MIAFNYYLCFFFTSCDFFDCLWFFPLYITYVFSLELIFFWYHRVSQHSWSWDVWPPLCVSSSFFSFNFLRPHWRALGPFVLLGLSVYYFVLQVLHRKNLSQTNLFRKPRGLLLHKNDFTQYQLVHKPCFYTNTAFTWALLLHKTCLCTSAVFTQALLLHKPRFCTNTVFAQALSLHKGCLYTSTAFAQALLLHKNDFTQDLLLHKRCLYTRVVFTQKLLLHKNAFTQDLLLRKRCLYTSAVFLHKRCLYTSAVFTQGLSLHKHHFFHKTIFYDRSFATYKPVTSKK